MSEKKKKVVVIGSGPGGSSTAMLLAHHGFDVTILEKNNVVGGRNAELKVGDFSFDTGPTFLHVPWVIEELFAIAGEKMSDHLDLVQVDPFNKIVYNDITINCWTDKGEMKSEIASQFPGSEERYDEYLQKERKLNQDINACLTDSFQHIWNYLRPSVFRAAPHVFSRDSIYTKLGRYFEDERLRMAMTFQSKYLGMTPWKCPGFLSILSSWEYLYGIYHVQGGLCQLSKTFSRLAVEKGAELRLNAEVEECVLKGKKITGVRLTSGEVIECDEVVMNADFAYAMTNLMGKKNIPKKKMKKKPMSCSTIMLYLGMKKEYVDQPHHQILMADDYKGWTQKINDNEVIPEDMAVYVRNSCVTDPTVAPEGKAGLYILTPVPNNIKDHDWITLAPEYREKMLDRVIERTGMKDLRENIEVEKMITPDDWEQDLNVFIGATFSFRHTLNQMLYFRPHNRYNKFKNCFLVGGGAHPGAGIIPILQSARISTQLLCKKHKVPYEDVDLHSDKL